MTCTWHLNCEYKTLGETIPYCKHEGYCDHKVPRDSRIISAANEPYCNCGGNSNTIRRCSVRGCALAGTKACLTCPNNNIEQWTVPEYYLAPIRYEPKRQRIIEKFDKDGKLIERITEG